MERLGEPVGRTAPVHRARTHGAPAPLTRVSTQVAPERCFLAADVGGTHTRVGRVRSGARDESAVVVLAHRTYVCADYPGLSAILADFTAHDAGPGNDRVVIACAGVVLDDVVVNANLPWRISLAELRSTLGLRELQVINDFQAAAHAAQCMNPEDSLLLTPGVPTTAADAGPVLVVGPGTGLGAAVRIPYRGDTVVLPTEAGQMAFAPGNAREIDILRWLQGRSHYVATEDLVSGPGLVNLYDAICALEGVAPAWRAPAAITDAARHGDAFAREAALTFCALLGSVIGDLVAVSSAKAVFIAGGILPKLKDFLPHSTFHARLLGKGALRAVLERVPVRLIENERLGVIGAASWYLQYVADTAEIEEGRTPERT